MRQAGEGVGVRSREKEKTSGECREMVELGCERKRKR